MATSITLKALRDGRKKANEGQTFRKLGSCDALMGIKAGRKCYSVTFSGFECRAVAEISEDELRDLDFYIEMNRADWEGFLASRNSGAPTGLNELDLTDEVVKSWDARRKLNFTRYHRSIEHFFKCVAA